MKIESHRNAPTADARFSILIPTWNNLPYLQCCVDSIRRHSTYPHQLIVHVNDGSDGTLEWVRSQGLDHTWSAENVGVCHALNAAAALAHTPYICFLNDDMAVLPDWDAALWREIASIGHGLWFISGTMIEPRYTGNPCALAPHDFGQTAETYREQELLADYQKWEMADWSGATWPPNVVPKKLWDEVGGYSVEFSPGMSSDPDFSMKLWQVGVRHFKGVGSSRVYHFQTKSTGKVQKNDGPRQFLQKWGITQGTLGKYFLRRGKAWRGPLPQPGPWLPLTLARIKCFLKKAFS
ncbi:MAG TPA: glycosyltransferase [Bacteroidia bacterium]|nr:glycosyltransferase [Bacteroidia bacterium]